jgi:hypothetical protein
LPGNVPTTCSSACINSQGNIFLTSNASSYRRNCGYITEKHFKELEADLNTVGKPLAGLIRSTKTMPREIDSWSIDHGDQI